MMWDLGSDKFEQVGAHDQPITCCGFAKGGNYECLVTGSLDKTVKMWDCRQSNPAMTFNCPEVVQKGKAFVYSISRGYMHWILWVQQW